ncbi:hypothetical protein FACS189492_1690 [Clostridia bacterium]|nr:hypothetical protein FACS189492_1690 [Clostridia bacterium]
MFGNHDYRKMVLKDRWDKIGKALERGDACTASLIAAACGCQASDGSFNTLIALLRHSDHGVRVAALRSLAKVGGNNAAANISWLRDHTPPDDTELLGAIHDALAGIREHNA